MISPKCYFKKKGVNKRAHISETPANQLDYPWFSKCPLNLGLEKPILINSADMSHLPPFNHRSILYQLSNYHTEKVPDMNLMCPIVTRKNILNNKKTLSRAFSSYAALSVVFSLPAKVYRLQILT